MRYIFLALLLLEAPHGALALTWDFDEDTTWGWTAQESNLSNSDNSSSTTVYSEVADGVWRIAPVPGAQRPAINLRSPWIGEDSALFDRVTLRLRIIHHTPTEGQFQIQWFNPEFRRLEEALRLGLIRDKPLYFRVGRRRFYPTEWEDITLDIRAFKEAALEADAARKIGWQDTLFYFYMELVLNENPQDAADHPAFLEVDWIQLTGVEELLLGELQPREVIGEVGSPGALLTAPRFFPLGEGVEIKDKLRPQSALGDVDGDGDMDLVVAWVREDNGVEGGWTVASNDGQGGFVPTRERILFKATEGGSPNPVLAGGDFDGDGLLDLAVQSVDLDIHLELWHNRGRDGFATILHLPDVYFIGLADGDGDRLTWSYGSTMATPGLSAAIGLSSIARRGSFLSW